jgi:hypothetical protein
MADLPWRLSLGLGKIVLHSAINCNKKVGIYLEGVKIEEGADCSLYAPGTMLSRLPGGGHRCFGGWPRKHGFPEGHAFAAGGLKD